MKIQIKSDLHKETRPDQYRANRSESDKRIFHPDADVLVLAGDITNWSYRFNLHHELRDEDRPIIYVPGNHEYYRAPNAGLVVPELKAVFEGTSVQVLDRDYWYVGNVKFIGATMWSDIPEELQDRANLFLNDFRTQGLTTEWYADQHAQSVDWIEERLKASAANFKRVVVTHHSPSFRSCHPRFENDSMNVCFHSNQHHLMSEDWAPQLWIHGHTHDACDYVQGNTRVICNPKGYPNEHPIYREGELPYNDDLIIEI